MPPFGRCGWARWIRIRTATLEQLMPGSQKTTNARKTSRAPKLGTVAATDPLALENARLLAETQRLLMEALSRQTATADILRVISSSPTDVRPVFEAIVGTAVRLLSCARAALMRRNGNTYSPVARASVDDFHKGVGPPVVPIDPAANFPSRVFVDKTMLHIPDWSAIDLPEHEQRIRAVTRCESSLMLPLLREDECIGVLVLQRASAGAFSESEIALAKSFVDQAVIAIENVRLFNETQEALERPDRDGGDSAKSSASRRPMCSPCSTRSCKVPRGYLAH